MLFMPDFSCFKVFFCTFLENIKKNTRRYLDSAVILEKVKRGLLLSAVYGKTEGVRREGI